MFLKKKSQSLSRRTWLAATLLWICGQGCPSIFAAHCHVATGLRKEASSAGRHPQKLCSGAPGFPVIPKFQWRAVRATQVGVLYAPLSRCPSETTLWIGFEENTERKCLAIPRVILILFVVALVDEVAFLPSCPFGSEGLCSASRRSR